MIQTFDLAAKKTKQRLEVCLTEIMYQRSGGCQFAYADVRSLKIISRSVR